MTTSRLSVQNGNSSNSLSSHTTGSPRLSRHMNGESDTVLMAKKLSSLSLAEREERQHTLDRLELLKTVRRFYRIKFPYFLSVLSLYLCFFYSIKVTSREILCYF